ncbi:MAG: hypothetical protein QOD72_3906, partial [Acidimicrobiaceae bacterium]|nr:hypothetical protein [Acidimicrobiaceae bacterium]
MVLIPTAQGRPGPAWLNWGGWNACPEPAERVAVLKRWYSAYGAQLVTMTSDQTMLSVSRPPATRHDALVVAQEHYTSGRTSLIRVSVPPACSLPCCWTGRHRHSGGGSSWSAGYRLRTRSVTPRRGPTRSSRVAVRAHQPSGRSPRPWHARSHHHTGNEMRPENTTNTSESERKSGYQPPTGSSALDRSSPTRSASASAASNHSGVHRGGDRRHRHRCARACGRRWQRRPSSCRVEDSQEQTRHEASPNPCSPQRARIPDRRMVFGAAMFRVAGRRLFVRSSRRTSRPIDIRPNRPR